MKSGTRIPESGGMNGSRRWRWMLMAWLLIVTLGCAIPIPTTQPLTVIELRDEQQTVALGAAERATVRLRLLAGDLKVSPVDTGALLEARFRYNVAEWEPSVKEDLSEGQARVTLTQGLGSQIPVGDLDEYTNDWAIGLRRGIPLDLGADLGGGTVALELGGLSLTDLGLTSGNAPVVLTFSEPNPEPLGLVRITAGTGDIVTSGLGNANFDRLSLIGGAGKIHLEFGGAWTRSAVADINAGVGEITVRVPAGLGTRVHFSGLALSNVKTVGFGEQAEDVYVNSAYGQAPLTLTVNVTTGIGSVILISE